MTTATAETPHTEDVESDTSLQWPYRMTYETYEQIAELGLIRSEEHVVLLDGILVQSMNKSPQHHNAVDRGGAVFRAALPRSWSVRSEGPVLLRDEEGRVSVPEPDLVVVFGSRERYEDRPPEAFDVGLLVEIASSPAAFRADRKGLGRYARAGIPTVWIVALHDRSIHVYTEPSGPIDEPGYARVEVKRTGELLEFEIRSTRAGEAPTILGPIAVGSFFSPDL